MIEIGLFIDDTQEKTTQFRFCKGPPLKKKSC